MACVPSKDSDQPGHPPSLIRVFAVRMKKAWVLSYPLSAQWRLWSDWEDAQADLSLCWAHSHFVGFVVMRLIFIRPCAPTLKNIFDCDLWPSSWQARHCPPRSYFCNLPDIYDAWNVIIWEYARAVIKHLFHGINICQNTQKKLKHSAYGLMFKQLPQDTYKVHGKTCMISAFTLARFWITKNI